MMNQRDKMQSLHNVSEVFAFLFAWSQDKPENELYFKEVVAMLEKSEIWEVMLAVETIREWIGDVFDEKDERQKQCLRY